MNTDLDFPKTKQRRSMHKKFAQDKLSEVYKLSELFPGMM